MNIRVKENIKIIINFLNDYEVNFSVTEISEGTKMNLRTVRRSIVIMLRKNLIDFEVCRKNLKRIPIKKYKPKK